MNMNHYIIIIITGGFKLLLASKIPNQSHIVYILSG